MMTLLYITTDLTNYTLFICIATLLILPAEYFLRGYNGAFDLDLKFLFKWWVNKSNENKSKKNKSNGNKTINDHLELQINKLRRLITWTFILWFLLYLLIFLETYFKVSWNLQSIENLLQNIGTLLLAAFYFTLANPKSTTPRAKNFEQMLLNAWIFVFLGFTTLELLYELQDHIEPGTFNHGYYFKLIYGLGQAFALFLIAGKLDDFNMSYYLRTLNNKEDSSNEHRDLYRVLIIVLYLYAALQPLYPYLDAQNNILAIKILMVFALALKCSFAILLSLIFFRKQHKLNQKFTLLSPMEHYLYESSRFSHESMSSYARSFIRENLTPFYHISNQHSEGGIIGIEYSYLNQYKLSKLLKTESSDYLFGIFIKKVYPGSHAIKKGIRAGDIITKINNLKIGGANRLSTALKGYKAKDMVTIDFMRDHTKFKEHDAVRLDIMRTASIELKLHAHNEDILDVSTGKEYLPKIRCKFIAHDTTGGIILQDRDEKEISESFFKVNRLKSLFWNKEYKIMDIHFLQLILEQMTAFDNIELSFDSESDDPNDTSHSKTILLSWVPQEKIDGSDKLKKFKIEILGLKKRTKLLKFYPNLFCNQKQFIPDYSLLNYSNQFDDAITLIDKVIENISPEGKYLCVFEENFKMIFETVILESNETRENNNFKTSIKRAILHELLLKQKLILAICKKPKLKGEDMKYMVFDSATFYVISI